MICARLPRQHLVHLPTPLEPATRLSEVLGVEVLIKREDLAGLCVGGNKARLLEFALGSLRSQGVDTLIATAAVQSNKLRDVAAAAARCGMKAVLLIPADSDTTTPQGNRLLMELLGAEVRHVPSGLDPAGLLNAQQAVCDEMARSGRHAAVLDRALTYGIDATVAYVDAAEELHGQLGALGIGAARVYITVGAGMTAAGLGFGLKLLRSGMRMHGVCVAHPAQEMATALCQHAERAATRLDVTERLEASDFDLRDEHLAPGYGIVTPWVKDAMGTIASLHGLVLDPVYNAKTAGTLLEDARTGALAPGTTVVLVNTGGSPGIYPHHETLSR